MALYRAYQQIHPLELLPGTEEICRIFKANLIAAVNQIRGEYPSLMKSNWSWGGSTTLENYHYAIPANKWDTSGSTANGSPASSAERRNQDTTHSTAAKVLETGTHPPCLLLEVLIAEISLPNVPHPKLYYPPPHPLRNYPCHLHHHLGQFSLEHPITSLSPLSSEKPLPRRGPPSPTKTLMKSSVIFLNRGMI